MTMAEGELAVAEIAFVRGAYVTPLPPPPGTTGLIGWLRSNLFSSSFNTVLTVLTLAFAVWLGVNVFDFLIRDAVWTGSDRTACLTSEQHPHVGACWPFVWERLNYFMYGSYPIPQRWRVDVFFILLAVGAGWMLWLDAPRRDLGAGYFFVVVTVCSFILLHGAPLIGLPVVDTSLWGGVLVTIVVSAVGIVVSLPLGILLALGRRSHMPVVRFFSVIFIEFVRGVPLITVLFMASVMLPLFVSEDWSPDKLLRALIGIALFASAYMAEVVRAGLQSIPRGQYEAATALGLKFWPQMGLVILPQALRVTIPNIVNTTIGLFKDTTLVFIVGIFDLLKTIEAARIDPKWATPVTSPTGYAVAAIFYWVFCYSMSRYAKHMELRLSAGRERR
jgi:general L-amino acid transport system permease protein